MRSFKNGYQGSPHAIEEGDDGYVYANPSMTTSKRCIFLKKKHHPLQGTNQL
jgi:hypothetical protein